MQGEQPNEEGARSRGAVGHGPARRPAWAAWSRWRREEQKKTVSCLQQHAGRPKAQAARPREAGGQPARTFLMIITRKGSLIPSVFVLSAGQDTKVVEMLVDMISSTEDWMSLSVMRLMWPLRTCFSQICSGLEPVRSRGARESERERRWHPWPEPPEARCCGLRGSCWPLPIAGADAHRSSRGSTGSHSGRCF